MWVDLLAFVIFAGITWAAASEGAWGAALLFVDVLLAALIATNFFQPVAAFLSGLAPEWRFWFPYLSLMVLFCLALALIRAATGALSPRLVRFPTLFEQACRWFFAAAAAWVFIGFFFMSLHTAPLPREFLGFRAERRNFFGTGADLHWLGFMHHTSRHVFDRGREAYVFDPQGIFLPSYASWRKTYENPEVTRGPITAEELPEEMRQ